MVYDLDLAMDPDIHIHIHIKKPKFLQFCDFLITCYGYLWKLLLMYLQKVKKLKKFGEKTYFKLTP